MVSMVTSVVTSLAIAVSSPQSLTVWLVQLQVWLQVLVIAVSSLQSLIVQLQVWLLV